MPRTKTDYSRTIIYVIKCKDDNITEEYIGSTTQFNERKCHHKSACNNEKLKSYNELKYKFIRDNGGWTNWIMLEVLKYPCNDKNEARMKEEEIRIERRAKLNSHKAFNTETKKEYDKKYREANKEEIKLRDKQYNEANKEIIKSKKKVYREANKEEINKKQNENYLKNKEELNKKHKAYYEANKDILNEKLREKRRQNKEKLAELKSQEL
jgi:hypothetical protein